MNIGVKLEPVANLLNRDFFIRSYQRGYRWNENQINDLLSDFKEFIDQPNKSEEEFYCLQPIVVKRVSDKEKKKLHRFNFDNNVVYEVIDGQQRITTITIILNFLKESLKKKYTLKACLQLFMKSGRKVGKYFRISIIISILWINRRS